MDDSNRYFSDRLNLRPNKRDTFVREEAPSELRRMALHIAVEVGLAPKDLRDIVCRALHVPPDPKLWSADKYVKRECVKHAENAEWFEIYDLIEAIATELLSREERAASSYTSRINQYFERRGIGWQLDAGKIVFRGPEVFEKILEDTPQTLGDANLPTASTQLHEAIQDLSRRPTPDLTGAIHHAMAALECVAREVSGERKSTLGEILKTPGLVPAPLDKALSKIWGFASERGRHVREGESPTLGEAQLIVGLAGTMATYLSSKLEETGKEIGTSPSAMVNLDMAEEPPAKAHPKPEVAEPNANISSATTTIADSEFRDADNEFRDSEKIIRDHCQKQYGADFKMRAYCEKQQKQALAKLLEGKPRDIPSEVFEQIRNLCRDRYPTDLKMRAYCERQQFNALRDLQGG